MYYSFSSRLLLHVLGVRHLPTRWPLLPGKVPIVQIPRACAQICRKAQRAEVRSECPACNLVYLAPNVGEVAYSACKRNYIDGSFDRSFEAEEEWHPNQVETKLDRVERCAMLEQISALLLQYVTSYT